MSIKAKYSPENRFKNFSEHWKSAKLVDLCEINSKTSGNLPDQFYYIDLESVNQGVLSDEIELLNRLEAPSRAQRLLEKGDVLYQTVRPYQRNNYLFNFDNTTEFVASTGYAVLKPRKVNSQFLYQIMNTDKFTKEVMARTTGTSFPAISPRDLAEIVIKLPSQKEQKKIGNFLSVIDNLINLKEKKIKKQKEIKSAYLAEMFPKEGEKYPKRRFEGYTEPWKTRKLGKLLNYEQPTDYLVNNDDYDDSYLTPVLTAGKSFLLGYTNETEGIYQANTNEGVIIFDDFTTSSHFVDFAFKVKSSAMKFLRTTQDNLNLYFLYNLLQNINYNPESHERHWISIFAEFEVLIPEEKEQQKIADFFKNLDKQISIEEEKLAKLKKLKQAYLNDLFVKKQ